MDGVKCMRMACCCSSFLCLFWPSLVIFGIVLMLTENPRAPQLAALAESAESYKVTSALLQSTTGNTNQQDAFIHKVDTLAIPGTDTHSIYLKTASGVRVMENAGPNLGTVEVVLDYNRQKFKFTSNPVAVRKPAAVPLICTIDYSSTCGTRTCCSSEAMAAKCRDYLDPSSSSSFNYAPNTNICNLGVTCGNCEYSQFISSLCIVARYTSQVGWTKDSLYSSCAYPFGTQNQDYTDAEGTTHVYIRSADDPFITLQTLSKGTMELNPTNEDTRNSGRGLLLCGIVCLVVLIVIIVIIRVTHVNVCDMRMLRWALGLTSVKPTTEEDDLEDPLSGGGSYARERGGNRSNSERGGDFSPPHPGAWDGGSRSKGRLNKPSFIDENDDEDPFESYTNDVSQPPQSILKTGSHQASPYGEGSSGQHAYSNSNNNRNNGNWDGGGGIEMSTMPNNNRSGFAPTSARLAFLQDTEAPDVPDVPPPSRGRSYYHDI